jgi:hypothetical protein
MVSGLDKLRELGLLTLEERRHRANMCMVRKIMHEENGLDLRTWFEKAETASGGQVTRSATEPLNLKVRAGRLEVRRSFFIMRMIEDWNRIPAAVKSMTSGYKFKAAHKKMREHTQSA